MSSSALLLAFALQVVFTLGLSYVSMKYIAPAFTRQGFVFNRGFWPSILVVTMAVIGGNFLSSFTLQLLVTGIPATFMYFQACPFLIFLWEVLFSGVAIFLVARMLPALASLRGFATALAVAALNFAVLTIAGLVLALAMSGLMAIGA